MTVQSTEQVAVKPKRNRIENLELVRKVWPWAFLVTLIVLFSIASQAANEVTFLSSRSVQGILLYATQVLLIGLAETFVIIAAGIDLATGWVLGFASVIAALVMQTLHAAGMSPVVTIGAGMLGGILVTIIPGLINGLLIARVKVPPFIATLGMGILVEGVALLISGGYPIARQPPYLGPLGNGSLVYFWPDHGVYFFNAPLTATPAQAQAVIPLMPNPVLATILVTLVCWYILAKTQFGQHLYAIGGNFEAAVRAGIPVKRTLIKVYIMAAVLSGIGGVIWAARFTSGAYNAGETTTLNAIAAVVIGGASMFGGEGTVVGTIIGALIIGTIQYGLVLLGVSPFWQYVAIGFVVILAVVMDQFGRKLGK
ncbi:D-allose transport system permease protein AlsC [Thermoflexales bacterium]|nr:D-allose transport system permease protein AlsC [Thermoflexales bacterium]